MDLDDTNYANELDRRYKKLYDLEVSDNRLACSLENQNSNNINQKNSSISSFKTEELINEENISILIKRIESLNLIDINGEQ